MEERRKTPRINEENDVTITVVSGENDFPKEKIIDNFTKDISAGGTKIHTNILLPADTLIELEFTSKGLRQQINALGKVKWVKVIIEDESYEAGVEFSGNASDAIKRLEDYISWKLKSNKPELIKKKLSPIDSADINTIETKEHLPIDSDDINTMETKERFTIDVGDINIAETKERPPIKNKQWIKIAIISLGTIILIVVLLKIFDFTPGFERVPVPNLKTAPVPVPAPVPLPEVTPTPEAAPVPEAPSAPEAAQKTKVIGNSDSKKYHLPGMKYYDAVKAYHRVEFNSEADAIKAGYNKAPQ
jgi:hypothetical protein